MFVSNTQAGTPKTAFPVDALISVSDWTVGAAQFTLDPVVVQSTGAVPVTAVSVP
jgi:hypothetical protein